MPEKIVIPAYLRETLYKRNVQINSLERLPRDLKKEVLAGKRPVLVFHDGKIHPARVKKASPESALLEFLSTPPSLQEKENLLVVIATDRVRYVLQGVIRKIGESLVYLEFVNPRVDPRLEIPGERVVFLSPLPLELFEALLSGKFFLLRDTNVSREALGHIGKFYVYDLIIDESENVAEEFERIMASPGKIFFLKDISRSGACVFIRKILTFPRETFPLYFRTGLTEGDKGMALSLGLVGLNRGVRVEGERTYLHMMWVKKLPEEVIIFLKGLFSETPPSPSAR
ncbi:hypothetical protein [Thermosulfurimonas sp. F29]|uniref:hypothetical protein n=1 Tax=Thermosulfurimonas sp. F29 TaxID=2867247 RepID=UPI001C830CAF|nr:hypothetical protein [Thermosulfurimonas sp. F29]MBX6422623.1 hypothetical protein [Thermosulfurimonas sp. F29]